MATGVTTFYDSIGESVKNKQANLIDMFAYFLLVECEKTAIYPDDIRTCFKECDLPIPARVNAHMSEGAKAQNKKKYIKTNNGYRLERNFRNDLSKNVKKITNVRNINVQLRDLQEKLPDSVEKQFLKETIDCFEVSANRASIIMSWNLTLFHLYSYIVNKKIDEFNNSLAIQTDRRIRIERIVSVDDFSDIPDSKFIEICRHARIISNDVKKILENKLNIRNSAAHPSNIHFASSKTIEVIEDLIANVVLKY